MSKYYLEKIKEIEQKCDEIVSLRTVVEADLLDKEKMNGGAVSADVDLSTNCELEIPWRIQHNTTTGQFNSMRSMGVRTDCKIVVVSEEKPTPHIENVHRLQLIRASPVFEAMLMGEMLEAKTGEITITDLSPTAVQNLIHFIYCDEIQLETFEEAYEVALAAEKYQIKQLLDISVSLLFKFLSCDNVWSALKLADHLKLLDLSENCIDVLQFNTLKCVTSEEFLQATEESIIILLEQDELNIDCELLLVDATINWARHEAKRRGLLGDDAGVRIVIEPNILRRLRLATITLERFKSGPGLSDWLTESEKEQIMEYQELDNAQILPEHLSSSKKQREKAKTITGYKRRKVHACKRKVITTEDNLKLVNRAVDCNPCGRLIRGGPLHFLTDESKCLHAMAVFRVNTKCRFLGFECPSRIFTNPDPTLLLSECYPFYNEILQIMFFNIGRSLSRVSPLNSSQMMFHMQFKRLIKYDSSMLVKFPKAIELEENNWYSLVAMFYDSGNEGLPAEYPYCTRPNKVVCKKTGVKFVIQTQKIVRHSSSKNDGMFKTFFVTTL